MTTAFYWDRPFPKAWQDALDRLSPAGDRLSSYLGVWAPGEPELPIQRFVIWQMRPRWYTGMQVRRRRDPRFIGLTQEPPRRHARWDPQAKCYRKWGGGMAMCDRLTYQLYQRTGRYGQRWWVLQGRRGGHRYLLTNTERKILGLDSRNQQRDVPKAGDLPYAPLDQRTLDRIGDLEQVALWHRVCARVSAQEHRWDAAEREAAEVARGKLADWLDAQWGETWDQAAGLYKQALRTIAPTGVSRKGVIPADNAAWREQFITEGT